jgi:prevent-host-death family protein
LTDTDFWHILQLEVVSMAKTVSLKEAQATYSLSVDKADLEQGPIILEHKGEPVAAIVSIEDYRRLVAEQDDDTWRQEQLQRLDQSVH